MRFCVKARSYHRNFNVPVSQSMVPESDTSEQSKYKQFKDYVMAHWGHIFEGKFEYFLWARRFVTKMRANAYEWC